MGRPRIATTSAELSAQIARVQTATQAQVRELEERRRVVKARENQRLGELLCAYLEGPIGADLRRILSTVVQPQDRELFNLAEEPEPKRSINARGLPSGD